MASWPISACKFSEKRPLLVSCNGPSDFQVPANAKIGSTMFSTTISREESLDYAYDVFRLRWGMDGENFHHFIVMPFDPANCEARYKP